MMRAMTRWVQHDKGCAHAHMRVSVCLYVGAVCSMSACACACACMCTSCDPYAVAANAKGTAQLYVQSKAKGYEAIIVNPYNT